MAFAFTAAYIEFIHDVVVAERMPFDEPIDPQTYRDRGGLDSAVNRPFQTYGGEDLHPTLFNKAAALFHSLACNHCFLNGNKRTAVLALDMFLTANGRCLLINNDDIYALAKDTVEAKQKGVPLDLTLDRIAKHIEAESVDFDALRSLDTVKLNPKLLDLYHLVVQERDHIRANPLNGPIVPGDQKL